MMPERNMANFVTYQLDGATVRKKSNAILFGKKAKGDRKLAQASEYIILKALEEGYKARLGDPKLRSKLIGTGKEPLVYVRDDPTYLPGDVTVLGLNARGNGQNLLGILLEKLRTEVGKNVKAADMLQKIPDAERLFNIITRRDLLLEQLSLGHFPTDYSLESLFTRKEGIPLASFTEGFAQRYPPSLRSNYYILYERQREPLKRALEKLVGAQRLAASRKVAADKEVADQKGTPEYLRQMLGTTDLAQRAYREALKGIASDEEAYKVQRAYREALKGIASAEEAYKVQRAYREALKGIASAEEAYKVALAKDKQSEPLLERDVLDEFDHGNVDWIERSYDQAIRKQAILQVFLEHTKVNYDSLLLSVAKKKFIDMYWGQRYNFDPAGKATQMTIEEFSKQRNVTLDTLRYIGVEALRDLRSSVYGKYQRGELNAIPDLEVRIAEIMNHLRHDILGGDRIVFPRFVPKVVNPSGKFLVLISEDQAVEPSSPRQTYGGTPLKDYYLLGSPEGACSDDVNAVCPLGGGDDDEEDDGGAIDDSGDVFDDGKEELEHDDEPEDEEPLDNDGNDNLEEYQEPEDEDVISPDDEGDADGDGDFSQAVKDAGKAVKKVPIQKYEIPANPIRFGGPNDYPYEWMSPDYLSMLKINGFWYPSISHYVAARLATPMQFKNVQPRLWIQKDPSYEYQFAKTDQKGMLIPDKLDKPGGFYPLDEIKEALPKRIQEIYNQLFVRYADRVINIKMRHYPFRQILFATGRKKLVYQDDGRQNAVGGKEIATIMTGIRDRIKDVVELTVLPAPLFDQKKAKSLYDYIVDRTTELIRATVLIARMRMSPRDNFAPDDIPMVGFEDARIALRYLYPQCNDINYNEAVEDPSDKYRAKFGTIVQETVGKFFPKRTIFDSNTQESMDSIRLKLEGKSEDPMTDKIFVNYKEVMMMIWTHIVYVSIYLLEDLPGGNVPDEEFDDSAFKGKLKDIRGSVFKMNTGSKEATATKAVLFLLSVAHQYYSQATQIAPADIQFVNNFIFPGEVDVDEPVESESYNQYPDLVQGLTDMMGSPDQPLSLVKKLAAIIDRLVKFPTDDKMLYNKLTIRVKFFSAQV